MSKNKAKGEYDDKALEHKSDLEHVRLRPGMYIGDTTHRGLHHLVYEVVDNSIDETMAGYATKVEVTINTDGSVTVEDDGRGIPVSRHADLSEKMGRDVVVLPILRKEAPVACLLVLPSRRAEEGQLRLLYSAGNQLCLHLDRILSAADVQAMF